MKYDDVSWHCGGAYPKIPPTEEHAEVVIGMFLTWCVENDLLSEELLSEKGDPFNKIKKHEATGAMLLWALDSKLLSKDLNDVGNAFAIAYYKDGTAFGKKYSHYIQDFCDIFSKKAGEDGFEYENLYPVEDTLENYLLIKTLLDIRFEQWKSFVNEQDEQTP